MTPPIPEVLLALAERVEKVSGPDQKLDRDIWLAAVADERSRKAYAEGLKVSKKEASFRADYMMDGARYTASLDSALSLVPEASELVTVVLVNSPGALPSAGINGGRHIAHAATPALALAAAALRARAALAEPGLSSSGRRG